MTLPVTIVLIALFAAIAVACGWRGARPPNPHAGPRMMPWRFLMIACAAVVLMLVVHVVNLLGATTGR
jgi:hypothetical protein